MDCRGGKASGLPFSPAAAAASALKENRLIREDSMSIRIVPAILAAAVSVAFGFPPANAQQAQKPQPPQSLRLYVLDCGKITPATPGEAYGLKPSEMASS